MIKFPATLFVCLISGCGKVSVAHLEQGWLHKLDGSGTPITRIVYTDKTKSKYVEHKDFSTLSLSFREWE